MRRAIHYTAVAITGGITAYHIKDSLWHIGDHVHNNYRKWPITETNPLLINNSMKTQNITTCDNKILKNVILPETGEFTAYKVCKTENDVNVYVELLVPANARRITSIMTPSSINQSRVECAKVVKITDRDGKNYDECTSFVFRKKNLVYQVGETIYPDSYNSNPEDCGNGIYVHLNKEDCDQWFNYHRGPQAYIPSGLYNIINF